MFGYLDACCRGTRADLTHCESHLIHHLKEIKLECFFSSFTSGNVLISCIKNFKCDFFIQQKLPCSRQWRLGLLRSRGFLVQIPLWNFYETSSEICSQPFVGSDLARWGGVILLCLYLKFCQEKRKYVDFRGLEDESKASSQSRSLSTDLLAAIFPQISFRSVNVGVYTVCLLLDLEEDSLNKDVFQ